ncbi:gfo/Idh/MocA family oxidoreductase [bacterium]|nr:gfo/Idh/MocA family oxidoreductase [bacterium]
MTDPNRRKFLEAAGSLATAASLTRKAHAADAPVGVALIGCGGMGTSHLKLLAKNPELKVVALSDVDSDRLAAAAQIVVEAGHAMPATHQDLRNVLDDKSVEAVWIATPDHWHAPAAILAARAGKHVYVEKPCSHNLREGRLMIEAARESGKVMQVGTQSRSTAHIIAAVERLKAGAIGDVLVAKAWNSQLRGNIGHASPGDPPPNLNFEAWLGPVPERPYQKNLLHSIWRFWYEFGVGDIGNDGVHDIDIARWGLGVQSHPSTVTAAGSKYFFDDDQQFPDTQYCIFEWPADGTVAHKRMLVYEQRDWSPYVQEGFENGNAFYGTRGMLILGKNGGWKLYGPRNKLIEEMSGGFDLAAHHQNFLDCIRSGNRPNADIEINHLSTSLCHLANIACRLGRVLHFEPAAEKVVGDDEADGMLRRTYREGHWAVPKGV